MKGLSSILLYFSTFHQGAKANMLRTLKVNFEKTVFKGRDCCRAY